MSNITKIRTIRLDRYPNIIWIEIETDDGLVGTGEAFRGTKAIEAIIHNEISPWLVGEDARNIENISSILMNPYLGFNSSSAEVRSASAIDIALWDLNGLRNGVPVHEALGGASKKYIQVYNTCSGYTYNNHSSNYKPESSRRKISNSEKIKGPYDDQIAFNRDAGELAKSLLSEGYSAMKIWPFDSFAGKTNGNYISLNDLEIGLEPFKKIRNAVGNEIEIICELHSLWNAPSALRISQALEDYNILWIEDPLKKMDNIKSLNFLRKKTIIPICGSETLAGSINFQQMISSEALDYVMVDLGWCGGLTEARKIANIAESRNVPITPHDCSGPVVLWAGIHLALHSQTGVFQEVVRANLSTWYKDLVTHLPEVKGGEIKINDTPGLGTSLSPNIKRMQDAHVRETK